MSKTKKPGRRWDSVPKWFKRLVWKRRKHKERGALRRGEEVPEFKKNAKYDYF